MRMSRKSQGGTLALIGTTMAVAGIVWALIISPHHDTPFHASAILCVVGVAAIIVGGRLLDNADKEQ